MSFVLVFSIFALIYKLAPYVEVHWRHVLPGALLAAVLFELGKKSIIVLLLWLYVSAVILIFGAEYNIVRWKTSTAATDPAT